MMKEIFENQVAFQQMLGEDVSTQEYKNKTLYALIAEVVEAGNETAWKSWKKAQKFNDKRFVDELADIQLFLINLCLSAGLQPEEFVEACLKKQDINVKRFQNGY